VVEGHERALFFSAGEGENKDPVNPGWYWHAPWNSYLKYDMRWTSHKEEIHIHSQDGLHMNIDVVVVVRPAPGELYGLDTEVGPEFYDQVVKPAVFAAARDAAGRFTHLDIAIHTHSVEEAISAALVEHLAGKHLEMSQVAIQHFDLPEVVETAVNRKAASGQMLAAREVDLALAQKDAEIDQARRTGAVTAEGVEKALRAKQELEQVRLQAEIDDTKHKSRLAAATADAQETRVRAQGEADATKLHAAAEKERIQSESQNLTPSYVRLQALQTLAKALSAPNTKLMVLPVGKNGLPAYYGPFLDPMGKGLETAAE
jgi:regulator of protease activity HflC (stomatin/prohibitin superfamily)